MFFKSFTSSLIYESTGTRYLQGSGVRWPDPAVILAGPVSLDFVILCRLTMDAEDRNHIIWWRMRPWAFKCNRFRKVRLIPGSSPNPIRNPTPIFNVTHFTARFWGISSPQKNAPRGHRPITLTDESTTTYHIDPLDRRLWGIPCPEKRSQLASSITERRWTSRSSNSEIGRQRIYELGLRMEVMPPWIKTRQIATRRGLVRATGWRIDSIRHQWFLLTVLVLLSIKTIRWSTVFINLHLSNIVEISASFWKPLMELVQCFAAHEVNTTRHSLLKSPFP